MYIPVLLSNLTYNPVCYSYLGNVFKGSNGSGVWHKDQRCAARYYVIEAFRVCDMFEVAQHGEDGEPGEQRRERVH